MPLPDPPPPTLRLRRDADALRANWRTLDRLSGAAEAGAAVKAEAYGLGVDFAVPALLEAGARQFFVAHWSEVAPVLQYVDGSQVAVLHGVGSEAEAAYAREIGALPVIDSLKQARLWNATGGGACHLMVDTGINRLGISPQEIGDPAIAALEIDTLMSHLACADEDSAMNARQLEAFRQVSGQVHSRRRSFANSAGIVLGLEYHFDMTRPGLALYGGIPRPELARDIAQVAFPEAAVLQLRDLSAGQAIGYNATFTAPDTMRVATVSIGYADGFLRARGKGVALQHDGRELPILGRVSMDMVVVDCAAAPDLREGDFLSIPFDLPSISRACGLSQYELLTTLGNRFARP